MRIYYEQTTLTYSIYCKKAKCTSETEKLEEGERENNSGRSNADSNENWKPLEPLVHLKIPFFYNSFEMNVNISNTRWPCNV